MADGTSAPARGNRRLHLPGGDEPAAQSSSQCRRARGSTRRTRCARAAARRRDREILVRFYLQEEEKEAICRDLALAPDQFDKVLHRARARLKELLEASGLQRSDFFMLCL